MGKLHWCTKFDRELTEDFFIRPPDSENCLNGRESINCKEDCPHYVFETENQIRARKAIEAGRKQPTLFAILRKWDVLKR